MLNKLLILIATLILIPMVINAGTPSTMQKLPTGKCYIKKMMPVALDLDTIAMMHAFMELEMEDKVLEMILSDYIGFTSKRRPIEILYEDGMYVQFLLGGEKIFMWTTRAAIECF